MKNSVFNRKIGILDWLIFLSIIIMIIMVYVPLEVWQEESKYKTERRNRMKYINFAEEFYFELTGKYTTDVNELFSLVESATDSLLADTTFIGKQIINLDGKAYPVNLDLSFAERVDTTFSIPEKVKKTYLDTLYKIGMLNEKNKDIIDTLWMNKVQLTDVLDSPSYVKKYFTHYENAKGKKISIKEFNDNKDEFQKMGYKPKKEKIEERTSVEVNYLRRKFHLNDDFIYCPISKNNDSLKFSLKIDNSDPKKPIFIIESPVNVKDNHNEMRYGIFRYRPGTQETIIGGVKSWAEQEG